MKTNTKITLEVIIAIIFAIGALMWLMFFSYNVGYNRGITTITEEQNVELSEHGRYRIEFEGNCYVYEAG